MSKEVFYKKARKCIVCGRLLLSAESIEKGYGYSCGKKLHIKKGEQKPVITEDYTQMSIFEWIKNNEIEKENRQQLTK